MKEREEVVASGDDMEKEAMPPLEPMPVSEDLPSLLEIASSTQQSPRNRTSWS